MASRQSYSGGGQGPLVPRRDWRKMTRTIAHYQKLEQIGEGTYGQVYKAKCLDTGRIVALKKIHVHHGGYWGMPPTVIREIKILKRLSHPSLVSMLEVVSSKGVEYLEEHDEEPERKSSKNSNDRIDDKRESYKGNIYLVLDYISHDLTGLMDVAYRFTEQQVKSIFKQLLEALQYMHEEKYIHRDIKSSNILIDSNFRVKLADFGLSRSIAPPILDNIHDRGAVHEFTNKVITLWYRPPEILLGATRYGAAVDMWSAGCILAELMLGRPLFTGKTEMEQLQQIFDLLGTPTADSWEGFADLKLMRTGEVTIEKQKKPKLRAKYGQKMPTAAMNLIEKLLELDPNKRLTASRALNSRYFLVEPRAPERPEDLGILQLGEGGGHFHEFQTKKKRREAKSLAKKASNEARALGLSEKEAEAEYDAVYRECMKKVAEEGNKALVTEVERREMERRDKEKIDEDLGIDAMEEEAMRQNGRDHTERSVKKESKKDRTDRKDEKKERSGRKRHRDDEDRDSRRKEDRSKRRRESDEHLDKSTKSDTMQDDQSRDVAPVAPNSRPVSSGEARGHYSYPSHAMAQVEVGGGFVAGFSPDPNAEANRKAEKSRKRTSSKEGSRREHRSFRERHGDSHDHKDRSRDRSNSLERRDRSDSREHRHRKSSRRDRDHESSSRRSKHRDKDNDKGDKASKRHEKRHDKDRDRRENRSSKDDHYSPAKKDDRRGRTGGDDRYGPPPDERRDRRERGDAGGPDGRDRNRDNWNGPPRDEFGRSDRNRRNEPDRRGPPPRRDGGRISPDRRGPPGRRDGGRNSPDRRGPPPPRDTDIYGPPRRDPMGFPPPQQQANPYGPPPGRYQQGPPPGPRGPLPPPGYRGGDAGRERHRQQRRREGDRHNRPRH